MNRALRLVPAWTAGLLWGAFVPAIVICAAMMTLAFLPFAIGISIVFALVLGLPVSLLFMWRRWTKLLPALAAGFVIGLAPIVILSWPPDLSDIKISLLMAAAYGALGAAGAGTFWLVIRACGALSPDGPQSLRTSVILALSGLCADLGSFVFI